MIEVLIPAGPHGAAWAERFGRLRGEREYAIREVAAGEAIAAGDHDVILADPAVEVAEGWLDRLAACAAREPSVATVSAFCNRARYAAYPEPGGAWPAESLAILAARFAAQNGGEVVDLPAAEPALCYVTQAALSQAGPLEGGEAGFGAFCARATAAGLRHLLAGDAVVFDTRASRPPQDESEAARGWRERDPTRPLRRRVDLARLAASAKPRLLLVSHGWGGGVERHVFDIARLAARHAEVLLLRSDGPRATELRWLAEGETLRAWFDDTQWDLAVDLLAALGIARIHYHHVHDLPRGVLDLPSKLAAPYDVTLHDYYPICPRYHLVPSSHASCDSDTMPAAGAALCERCLDAKPAQWGLSLDAWRATFHVLLKGAERVIAPSHDCAQRVRWYFPDVSILEWPHPESPAAPPALFKVALLGGISVIKGARVLEACAADARARNLPLHFHVIGSVDRPMAVFPEAPLTIGGSYAEDALPRLIAIQRPDAFLFLSQVAETYSYTLSSAMATGAPVVALATGAFPERLRDHGAATLLPREASAATINDALVALLRSRQARGSMVSGAP